MINWDSHWNRTVMGSEDETWRRDRRQLAFAGDPMSGNIYEQVQTALNQKGMANPPLKVDGNLGPLTNAAISKFQTSVGLSTTGKVDSNTLSSLGLVNLVQKFNSIPNVATVVAALTQAAKEKGFTLSPQLASLMIGQLRGAEGTMPGLSGTLGGTNNYGAAQVTKSLASLKQGLLGWGAFAHRDSDPNTGAYIGWYWIAPSPLEGARYWLDNWWGKALLQGNPQTPSDYATILYKGRYFAGMHAGDSAHDPTSEAGSQNVNDYAGGIKRGMPSAAEMNDTPKDPSALTVDPSSFASLTARGVTEDMFSKSKGGAWDWLLPSTWENLLASNGAIFFGPAPGGFGSGLGTAGRVGLALAPIIALGGVGLFMLLSSKSGAKFSRELDKGLV